MPPQKDTQKLVATNAGKIVSILDSAMLCGLCVDIFPPSRQAAKAAKVRDKS
jgi:hypothetical protein